MDWKEILLLILVILLGLAIIGACIIGWVYWFHMSWKLGLGLFIFCILAGTAEAFIGEDA